MRLARAAVLAAACASLLATHAAAGLSCLPRFNQYFDVVEASQQQGKMVMVGSCSDEVGGQLVFVSADHGHTWKAAPQFTVPNLMMLTSVAYSPDANVFVAVGGVASTIYSSDGVNWAASQNGVRNYFFNGVRYLGGNFLAGASFGTVLASADGVNWRNLTGVRAVMRQEVESFALGSQVLVAVGGQYDGTGPIVYSSDASLETWHAATVPDVLGGLYMRDVTYSPALDCFVAVGTGGEAVETAAILFSRDGASWSTAFNSSVHDSKFNGVTFVPWGGGFFVAVGNLIATSADGRSWNVVPASQYPSQLGFVDYLDKVVTLASAQSIVAVGNNNRVWTSPDGRSWKQSGPPADEARLVVEWSE